MLMMPMNSNYGDDEKYITCSICPQTCMGSFLPFFSGYCLGSLVLIVYASFQMFCEPICRFGIEVASFSPLVLILHKIA